AAWRVYWRRGGPPRSTPGDRIEEWRSVARRLAIQNSVYRMWLSIFFINPPVGREGFLRPTSNLFRRTLTRERSGDILMRGGEKWWKVEVSSWASSSTGSTAKTGCSSPPDSEKK